MAQITKNLRLTMQDTNDNPDTWGTVLNASMFKLLEDAVAKREVIDGSILGTTVSLSYGDGQTNDPDARAMLLDCINNPGGPVTITAPVDGTGAYGNAAEFGKVYLVRNGYSPSYDITFKTAAGTGVTVPAGETRWVFIDSTDAYLPDAGDVTNATNATNSTNAKNLESGGTDVYVSGEDFVRKDLGVGSTKVQAFTQGQNAVREELTWGGTIPVPNQNSNAFFVDVTSAISATFQNPTTQTADADGQVIRIMIHHQTSGATITWENAYVFPGGTPPTLTTGTAGAVDYVAFEYFRDFPGGGKWVGNALLDVS